MRILLVEDDAILTQILSKHLTVQHHVVDITTDGITGLNYAQTVAYDLIVLDVNLPQMDGIRLCQTLRQNRSTVPILLLTAKGDSSDKVMGLDAGADDYVVKPCTVEEISARIRALLRRPSTVGMPVLTWGNLCLDPVTCEVTCDRQPIALSPKEYSLLELFLRNPQRTFSSSSILEHLWSFEDAPGEETIRSHIKRLRHKLKAAGTDEIIDTVYGMGYRLKLPPVPCSPPIPPPSVTPSAENEARSTAIALWEQFKDPILERITLLDQAVAALKTGQLPETTRQSAAHAAHKLTGSLAMFGFPASTQLVREIEELLQNPPKLSKIAVLEALVDELHQVLHHSAAPPTTSPTTLPQKPDLTAKSRVLMITPNVGWTKPLQTAARDWGMQITVAANLPEAQLRLATGLPDVMLLDLAVDEGGEDGLTVLEDLKNQFPQLPVVLLTSQDDFTSRLAGIRCKCDRFITKPAQPIHILAIVQELLSQTTGPTVKVLAVDDDPVVLDWLNRHLPRWGITLTTLNTPDAVWQTLATTLPDLVILDIEMPSVTGIELCKVIRSDRAWEHLPILFLTGCREPGIIQQIYEAGADDYVSKPFVESEVVTRIFNRLKRNRLLGTSGKTKP